MKKLKVSRGAKFHCYAHCYAYELLERICTELCGGGWLDAHTKAAMLMASELREGKVVTCKGFTLQVVEVEDAAV